MVSICLPPQAWAEVYIVSMASQVTGGQEGEDFGDFEGDQGEERSVSVCLFFGQKMMFVFVC